MMQLNWDKVLHTRSPLPACNANCIPEEIISFKGLLTSRLEQNICLPDFYFSRQSELQRGLTIFLTLCRYSWCIFILCRHTVLHQVCTSFEEKPQFCKSSSWRACCLTISCFAYKLASKAIMKRFANFSMLIISKSEPISVIYYRVYASFTDYEMQVVQIVQQTTSEWHGL